MMSNRIQFLFCFGVSTLNDMEHIFRLEMVRAIQHHAICNINVTDRPIDIDDVPNDVDSIFVVSCITKYENIIFPEKQKKKRVHFLQNIFHTRVKFTHSKILFTFWKSYNMHSPLTFRQKESFRILPFTCSHVSHWTLDIKHWNIETGPKKKRKSLPAINSPKSVSKHRNNIPKARSQHHFHSKT